MTEDHRLQRAAAQLAPLLALDVGLRALAITPDRVQGGGSDHDPREALSDRGDLARRVVHLRLESPEERPEERAGFKIQDLLAYAQAHRAELAAAALTVLRAWVLAGRPIPPGLKPWGSFEGWARTVCAAVVWAGLADPGDTREAFREEADVAATANGLLLRGLIPIAQKSGNRFTALQVLEELDRDAERCRAQPGAGTAYEELREALGELGLPQSRVERNAARRLGASFRSLKTRVIGGMKIVAATTVKGGPAKFGTFWKLEMPSVNSTGEYGVYGGSGSSYDAKENVFFINACAFGNGGRNTPSIYSTSSDDPDDYPRGPGPDPGPGEDYPRDPSDADGGSR